MRTAELSYLEAYEKYFILYNSLNAKEYKIAIQYLWLFQKLNTSTVTAMEHSKPSNFPLSNSQNNEDNVFKFFQKATGNTNAAVDGVKSNLSVIQHNEKTMHTKAMLTIYLANNYINEAYDFVKPHLKRAKCDTTLSMSTKQSREIVLHFFVETERFKVIKKICRISFSDQDLLGMLINYLEAKQDLNSIAIAINLHIDHRSYNRAIYLYGKYSKQIASSEFEYLTSLVEIIQKESTSIQTDFSPSKLKNPFTLADIKESAEFQYKSETSLSDLCKNSKRCLKILNQTTDEDHILMMRLPEIENLDPTSNISVNKGDLFKSKLSKQIEASTPSILSKTLLTNSLLKRKSSTPQNILMNTKQDISVFKSLANIPATDAKVRVLHSALKASKANSVAKSVKFNSSRYSRLFDKDDQKYVDNEEKLIEPEARKLFDENDDENESKEKEEVVVIPKKIEIEDSIDDIAMEEEEKEEDEVNYKQSTQR